MRETRRRAVTKALTYRFWQSANMFVIAYLVTGSVQVSSVIVGIEFFVKIIVYFIHERIWEHVKWGRHD